MKYNILLPLLLFINCSFAQVLKPSIGISNLPNDSDSICSIPYYLGSFNNSGYQIGDTVPDFTLYDLMGDSVNLAHKLQQKKPVLLISSSYTCPVFRRKIPEINQLLSTYQNDILVYVIYTVEAHPLDTSPYFARINITQANINDSILYYQPQTYGERKAIAQDLVNDSRYNLQTKVLIDGTCNEWWTHFGPAPNNAYLIDTNGIVFSKHPWFDKAPNDMKADIDSILGNGGSGGGGNVNGRFQFYMLGDTLVKGKPGETLYGLARLKNVSQTDGVWIKVVKLQKNYPADWSSSICLDACYPTTIDTVSIFLAAGDSIDYTMYFYTGSNDDTGNILMGFRNESFPSNQFRQRFYALTDQTLNLPRNDLQNEVKIFPNPTNSNITISLESSILNSKSLIFKLYDVFGKKVKTEIINQNQQNISLENLAKGIYFYEIFAGNFRKVTGKIILQN